MKPVYGRIIDKSKPFTSVDGRKQHGAKITLHTTCKTDIIFLIFYKPNKNSNYKSIRQKWDFGGGGDIDLEAIHLWGGYLLVPLGTGHTGAAFIMCSNRTVGIAVGCTVTLGCNRKTT